MQVDGQVEVIEESDEDDGSVTLNITGNDLGILIGRRGDTLRDLQFLTRLIVSRKLQRWPNIVVDVEYYKARREKLLQDLARRMAERVRLNQQPIALEPMPAYERRIVHIALRDVPDVYTESTGEGQARKVVIMPKP
jgi:spoIIIJ-associated protein